MDQRAHGRRAFHGVGQPRVQGELRALPDRAAEQEERDQGEELRGEGVGISGRHLVLNPLERQIAEDVPNHEDSDEEQDVTNSSHEERLLRGRRGLGLVVPEADQQVRAEAHDLPENQELEEVVRRHGA